MSTKRILSAALALLLVAAMPARATSVPTLTVIDTINPGAGSSGAMDRSTSVALSGYLYFNAYDGTNGYELWRTNGTTTTLVEDINTANIGADGSAPDAFTVSVAGVPSLRVTSEGCERMRIGSLTLKRQIELTEDPNAWLTTTS